MARACALAAKGEGHTRPNPPVGAIVVKGGKIVGCGYHARAGESHAETVALADCRVSPRGSTMYVTLEPCSRPGRVGACTDAIIAAGVKKVVYGMPDPNPANRGRAKRIFARAGIECIDFSKESGECEACRTIRRMMAPFAKHVTSGLPFVTVKIAMSLDGMACDRFGDAKWISSEASRAATGDLRRCCDAIMVGAGTIRKDDPSLLWHEGENRDLIRVVVSKSGKLPPRARVFTDGKNPTLVFRSPREAMEKLGGMGCLHVLCEGGLSLARSMAGQGFVDRWITVVAPMVIGSRRIGEAFRFAGGADSFVFCGEEV